MKHELVIIGGGAAGLSAAIEARKAGVEDILIVERSESLGGILRQCIHSGFGVHKYKENLTGVEFAQRLRHEVNELNIEYLTGAFVIDMSAERKLRLIHPERGIFEIEAGAIILAMGCRERSRGALMIPGKRIAGVITSGAAQRCMNLSGYLPGKKIVILGSGDIGLIMARQFALEGAEVKRVVEIMPRSGGLSRNLVQCLEDFGIEIVYNSTVTDIQGKSRVERVTVSKVDENMRPVVGSEEVIDCDTLLISAGLIPENELTKAAGIEMDPRTKGPKVDEKLMCSAEGIFACGNVLHIHELVDHVAAEGAYAGKCAAEYLGFGRIENFDPIPKTAASYGREDKAMICLNCPRGCRLSVEFNERGELLSVSGNHCKRGEAFARQELQEPVRVLNCLMRVSGQERVFSVKSSGAVAKRLLHDCAKFIYANPLPPERLPVKTGDVLFENILNTGVDIVSTMNIGI